MLDCPYQREIFKLWTKVQLLFLFGISAGSLWLICPEFQLSVSVELLKLARRFVTGRRVRCLWDRWVRPIKDSCVVYRSHSFFHAVFRGKRYRLMRSQELGGLMNEYK